MEAFFYLADSGQLPVISAQFAHAVFLRDWGLEATTVPLLEFDPQSGACTRLAQPPPADAGTSFLPAPSCPR